MKKILAFALLSLSVFAGDFEDGLAAYKNADYASAFEKFNAACMNKNAAGCEQVALMYHTGKSVKKDVSKAFSLYLQACEAGQKHSCSMAGGMQDMGEGTKIDKENAMKLLIKACELNDAHSCAVVGSFYLEKQTPDSLKTAKNLFQKACDLGDRLGCMWAEDLSRSKKI